MAKNQNQSPVLKSQFSRFTRMMALFTASLFLVSTNLAYAHPADNGGLTVKQLKNQVMTSQGLLTRHELRTMRKEIRAERNDSPFSTNPGFGTRPTAQILTPSLSSVTPKISITKSSIAKNNAKQQRQDNRLSRFVTQQNAGDIVKLDNGVNLDLTGSTRNITLGDKLFKNGGEVTIQVGGETKHLYAGSQVTAAEYVAAKQVLSGGSQQLVVDSNGKATGGQVDLNSIAATKNHMKADSLTVANGVTAVGDLAKGSSFKVTGDLNNFGSIYTVSTKNGRHAGDITADNVTNNEGALISSNAGSAHGNQASAIDLSINANNNFTNLGTVESSGDLNISAGNKVTNGASSNITANDNVNISSPNVVNGGTIASVNGNVTLDTPTPQALNVDNSGGSIKAVNGAINLRGDKYNAAFNTTVNGGDLLSKDLNLHTGQGTTDVNVNDLTGTVYGTGTAAHVSANTDTLVIGKTCLTGDPTFKNAGGDVQITGNIQVGETLAILASGNITSTNAVNLIEARNGNVGQDILMAAGFTLLEGLPTPTDVTVVNGAASVGGSIDLSASAGLQINANGLTSGSKGGNVTLLARANSGNTVGQVILATDSVIDTRGNNAANGNITVIAGRDANVTGIQLGTLNADGGTGSTGGVITVRTAQPSAGGGVVVNTAGAITSGSFSNGPILASPGIIIGQGTGQFIAARDGITIDGGNSGTFVNLGDFTSISTQFGQISITSGNNGNTTIDTQYIVSNGGDIVLLAGSDLNISADVIDTSRVLGSGGNVLLRADNDSNSVGSVNASGVDINTYASGLGVGGDVTVDTNQGTGFTQGVQIGQIWASGFSGTGGNVTIQGGGAGVTTRSIFGAHNVDIDTTAFNSNININGDILADSLALTANGTGVINTLPSGISITVDAYQVDSALNAGTGTVIIETLTNGTTIGMLGGAGALNISTTEFNTITASNVVIGKKLFASGSGNITIGGPINVAGTGAGKFDLTLLGNADLSGGANPITLGDKDLVIDVNGNVTTGAITANAGGNALILSGGNATVSGASGGSTGDFTITAAGNIQVGSVVYTGSSANINYTSLGGTITTTGANQAATIAMLAPGDINIGGNVTAVGGIAIISGQDITTTAAANFASNNVSGNGSTTTLIAGADYTNDPFVGVTINGASATGGNINIPLTNSISTIGGAGSGGGANLIAFSNLTIGIGQVNMASGSQITTRGSGSADASGDVNIYAGSTGGSAISIGSIITTTPVNGLNGSGDVNIYASQPTSGAVVSTATGTVGQVSGTFAGGSLHAADIKTENITARGATVTVQGSANVGLGTVLVSGNNTANADGGLINITANGTDPFDIGATTGSNYAANLIADGGLISGDGGRVNVLETGGAGIRVNSLSVFTTDGDGGRILLTTLFGGDIAIGTGTVSVDGKGANRAGGLIDIDASGGITVFGSGNLLLSAKATSPTAGFPGVGRIDLATGDAAIPLTFGSGVGQILVSTSGVDNRVQAAIAGNLTVASSGAISADEIVLQTTNVNSDLVVNGNLTATDFIVLNAGNDLRLNSAISGATSVDVRSQTGVINQIGGSIVTPLFDVEANDIVTINTLNSNTNDQIIHISGDSDSFIVTQATGVVSLPSSSANSIVLNAGNSTSLDITGSTGVNGLLDLTTTVLNNPFNLVGGSIFVQSSSGNGLTVNGGPVTPGSFTALSGDINFEADTGDLTFTGNTNFFGVANLSSDQQAPFGSIVIASGANVIGNLAVNLYTCSLLLNGNLVGNPINFYCPLGGGTIANSLGDVLLTSDINFNGLNLAIIAAGSILDVAPGTISINLSRSSGDGNGGTLTMVSGFDFTPATPGQVDFVPTLFTLGAPSGQVGEIDIRDVNINTSAASPTSANAGSVLVVARNGAARIGAVNATSVNGSGGGVRIIGEDGIFINGDVNTTGVTDGDVSLDVALPSIIGGTVLVGNGTVTGTGAFMAGVSTPGNMAINGINVGNGSVFLRGANGVSNTIFQDGSPIIADTLNIIASNGQTTITTSDVNFLNVLSNDLVQIVDNTGPINVVTVTGGAQLRLLVQSSDTITFQPAVNIQSLSLVQDNVAGQINVLGAVNTTDDIILNSAGQLNISNNLISAGGVVDLDGASISFQGSSIVEGLQAVTISSAAAITGLAGIDLEVNGGDVTINNNINIVNGLVAIGGAAIDIKGVNTQEIQIDGDSVVTGALTAGNSVFINSANGVNVAGAIDAGGTVTIDAGSIALVQGAIDAGDTVDVTGGVGITVQGAITVGGTGSILLNAPTIFVQGAIDAADSVDIGGAAAFTTQANITAGTGLVNITTNQLNNTFLISGPSVTINSQVGFGLVIDGSAAPGGTITATGLLGSVDLNSDADVTFFGAQTFNGTTNIDPAMNQSVIVSNGAVVTGNDTVNLNTCSLILQGNGIITGNPLNFNCPGGAGTIANSSGDVDLSLLNLVFDGQALAIIASGSVIAGTNTIIDLTGTDDGGNLTVIAGYDFTPATVGQENFVPTVFTLGAANSTGGDIDLSGLDIFTTGLNGNAGNVTLIANGGSLHTGAITVNSITATASNIGGDVLIVGEGGVFVAGPIDTTDALSGGSVDIAVAQPTTSGLILVANGEITGGGSFGVAGFGTSDIDIADIFGNNISVRTGGGVTVSGVVSGNGNVSLVGDGSVVLNGPVTSFAGDVFVSAGAAGTLDVNGGIFGADVTLIAGLDITLNDSVTAHELTLVTTGNVIQTAGTGVDAYRLSVLLGSANSSADLSQSDNYVNELNAIVGDSSSVSLNLGADQDIALGFISGNNMDLTVTAHGSGSIVTSPGKDFAVNNLTLTTDDGGITIASMVSVAGTAALTINSGNADIKIASDLFSGTNGMFFDTTAGTQLLSGDDDSIPVIFQFAFPFFGMPATTAGGVSTNGNLFIGGAGNADLFNVGFPALTVDPQIALNWTDLVVDGRSPILQLSNSSSYVLGYNGVRYFGDGGNFNGQVGILDASNTFGLPGGTVVLSFGLTQNPGSSPSSLDTIGLNANDGVNFATLNSLGIGNADGTITRGQIAGLAGRTFTFTPNGSGYNVAELTGTLSGGLVGAGDKVLVNNGNGNITLNGALSGNNVSLSSNGNISQSAAGVVTATGPNGLSITLGNPTSNADLTTAANNVALINGSGMGSIALATSFADLTIGNLGVAQSLTASTTNSITTSANIFTSGDINLTTNTLFNSYDVAANSITVQSNAGSGFTLDGTAAPGGALSATGGSVDLIGTLGDVTFFGEQTFNGTTNINPSMNQSVVVSNGAVITGNDTVNLNTCSLILQGNGVISGNPLNFNCPLNAGTIANSSGDVNLSALGALVFFGKSLAILASGNVIAGTNTSINLGGVNDGGDLLVVSGYDFTPVTGGQVNFSPIVFTLGNPNATGGNIDFSGLDITTNSIFGEAGKIRLIANGGSLNAGTINLRNVSANSNINFAGGEIDIIAEGGVTANSIVAGGLGGGTINIAVAQPVITGGSIIIASGEQLGTGSFVAGVSTNGNVGIDTVSVGTGSFNLIASNGAGDTAVINSLTAGDATLTVGAGDISINNSTIGTLNATGGTGSITLGNESDALALNVVTGGFDLAVAATGAITTSGNDISVDKLDLISGSTITLNDAVTANDLDLQGTSITLNDVTTVANSANLSSTAGDITIASTGSLVGAGAKNLDSGANSIFINGALTGATVDLTTTGGNFIQQPTGAITTGVLTLNLVDGMAGLFDAGNAVDLLNTNVSGTGEVFLNNGNNNIAIGSINGFQQTLEVETTGTIDLTQGFIIDQLVLTSASDLFIDQALIIDNFATITTNLGNIEITDAGQLIGAGTKSLNSAGSINLAGGLAGDSVSLRTTNNSIFQQATSSIIANTLSVELAGLTPGTAQLDAGTNTVNTLNAFGGGTVIYNNDGAALAIGNIGATQSLTAMTSSPTGMTILGNLTTTGDVNLTTDALTNQFTLSANSITVASNASSGLIVNGGTGGTFTATGAGQLVTFTATGATSDLNLQGNITFGSNAATFVQLGQTTHIEAGANVVGQQTLTVTSCNLDWQGMLSGNPLVLINPCQTGATIANSQGDVTLTGDIIFVGDFAILAANNINFGTATTINLDSGLSNAGNLSLMAGFDFTPATSGQEQTDVQFTITGLNADGGNIDLTNVTISLLSASGTGGSLLAVANGGLVNAGNVTLGNIATSGSLAGGGVTVIAEGDITLGTVNTTGPTAGNVRLVSAEPVINGTITVTDGVVAGGTFDPGTFTNGAIQYGNINAGTGTVVLSGDLSLPPTGVVTADTVEFNTIGGIGASALSRLVVNANSIHGSAGNSAFIANNNTGLTTLDAFTAGGTFDLIVGGDLAVAGAQQAQSLVYSTGATGKFSATANLQGTSFIVIVTNQDLTNTEVAANLFVTPLLTILTGNGADIGNGAANPLQVAANVGEIRVNTALLGGGSASIESLATTVNLGLTNVAGDFNFLSNGSLNVIDNVTVAEGNISITGETLAAGSTVRIDDGTIITANSAGANGNIFIGNALNGGNKKTDFIEFGVGAQVIGNAATKPGGNVTIQLGAALDPSKIGDLKEPKNVTFDILNGGTIVGGKGSKPFGSVKNPPGPNNVKADNAQVLISNTLNKKNIVMEGNVQITADPPSTLATSVSVESAKTERGQRNLLNLPTIGDAVINSDAAGNQAIGRDALTNVVGFSTLNLDTANLNLGSTTNSLSANGATAPNVNTLLGAGSNAMSAAPTEDNSFMVAPEGPSCQTEASVCSDSDLGLAGNGITAHNDRVVIKKGNVLFVPFRKTVVETPHGKVSLEANAVALVSVNDETLSVYDIEDSHKGSVAVEAHGHSMALAPGSHLTLAKTTKGEFAQVNNIEAIPHRNVASKDIANGVRVHSSEFSIAAAMKNIKPLQAMASSKHPQAKKVSSKLIKTTAILMHLGGGADYQHYFKAAITAMAK